MGSKNSIQSWFDESGIIKSVEHRLSPLLQAFSACDELSKNIQTRPLFREFAMKLGSSLSRGIERSTTGLKLAFGPLLGSFEIRDALQMLFKLQ